MTMKILRIALALIGCAWLATADAQSFPGKIHSGNVYGNPAATEAPGTDATLSALFDRVFGTTPGLYLQRGASLWGGVPSAGTPPGVATNVLHTATANYTIAASDCGATVQLGTGSGGPFQVTIPAAAGLPATCVFTLNNLDAQSLKFVTGFPGLFPGQTTTVSNVNGAWVNTVPAGRYRPASGATFQMYADASLGSDSNDCLAAGAGRACLTLGALRTRAQQFLDLRGTASVVYNATGAFTVGISEVGPLVGQANAVNETWAFASGSTIITSGGATALEAVYGAQFEVTSVAGNFTVEAPSAGVCVNSSAGGAFIGLPAMTLLGCNGVAIQTGWGGTIIVGGNLNIEGNAQNLVFVSGGVVQFNPGLTHTFSNIAIYSSSVFWAYAGGILGINGQTWVNAGNASGSRFRSEYGGQIVTGSGSLTYLPGSTAGTTATGGQYDTFAIEALANGGTNANLSATGGAGQVLRQSSAGAAVTVSKIAASDLSDWGASAWTPTVVGATTAGSATYTVQVGSYEQIGRHVTVRFNVHTSAFSGAAGALQINGLPLAAAATTNDYGVCSVVYKTGVTLDAGYQSLAGIIINGVSYINLVENGVSSASQNIDVTAGSASMILIGTCEYHT